MFKTEKWELYKKYELEKKELKLETNELKKEIKLLKMQLRKVLMKIFALEKQQYNMLKGVKKQNGKK